MAKIKIETEFGNIFLTPLRGRCEEFTKEIEKLERPYIAISKDEYNKIYAVGNDYFKYKGKVVTFGNADNGYALMPLNNEESRYILNQQ